MASLVRNNITVTSLLLMMSLMTYARADDFQELSMERKLGRLVIGSRRIPNNFKRNGKGYIYFQDDLLVYRCRPVSIHKSENFADTFEPFEEIVYPKYVAIHDCNLPTSSPLAEVFEHLKLNVPSIEFLQIEKFGLEDPLPKANYMRGLNIKSLFLDIVFADFYLFVNNPDFLYPLSNLTSLMIWGSAKVPEIPENIKLEILSLRRQSAVNEWKNCKHLRVLSIDYVEDRHLPKSWPDDCQKLAKIRLTSMKRGAVKQIMESIRNVSQNLEVLHMQNCELDYLPYEMLKNAQNLKHLNLTYNRINDGMLMAMPFLPNLTNLDLSRNYITGLNLPELVNKVPNLKYLNLEGNRNIKEGFCNRTVVKEFALHLSSLQWLSFKNVLIPPDCFENVLFLKLEYLNLESSEKTETFDLRKLPVTATGRLEVDLRGRHIEWVDFNSKDYFSLRKGVYAYIWGTKKTLHLHLDISEFNCRNYWFCLALKDESRLIEAPGVNCSVSNSKNSSSSNNYTSYNNNSLKDIESLNCTVELHNGCTILSDKEDKKDGIIVRCNDTTLDVNDLNDLVDIFRITKIVLQTSSTEVLRNKNFHSEHLESIDLRGNNLTHVDIMDFTPLIESSKRNVLLSNNSFECDCGLVTDLQLIRSQIADYDQIICAGTNVPLRELTVDKVCNKTSYKSAFIITASIIFVIQVTLLSWWYKNRLRRFFYKRGWCQNCCCCRVEEKSIVAWQSADHVKTISQQDLVEE